MKVIDRIPTSVRKAIVLKPGELLEMVAKQGQELPAGATVFVAIEQPDGRIIRHALDRTTLIEIPYVLEPNGTKRAIQGRRAARMAEPEPEQPKRGRGRPAKRNA
jgi:hypothetical protein